MASFYYGVNRGQSLGQVEKDITVGTSTGSTDVELRIDETKNWTRAEIAQFLEIARDRWASPAKNAAVTTYPDI